MACSRPYAAYINTSAEVIGGTQMVSRLSTVPSPKSLLYLGFLPSAMARSPTHRPRAPRAIAAQITIETNHSLGSSMTPDGRYQGGKYECRGPSVKVTAEGPRNPASNVSAVAPTMPNSAN